VIPTLLLDPLQLDLHLLAQLQVERAERLVEEEHLRVVDDRPRRARPAGAAAGELHRLAVAEALEPDERRAPRRPADAAPGFFTPFTRSPYSTFWITVMCGKSA
jgi:hypothetical protein